MRFALNFSPEAARLLEAGAIEVDVYKCPPWPDMLADARQQRPAYVHFPLMAGHADSIDKVGVENIEQIMRETGTQLVNIHLAPRATDYDIPLETRDPFHAEMLAEAMLRDLKRLADHFGAEQVIAENVPWDPSPKYAIPYPVIEPEFVSRIVETSGCGFLLDIAHARIAALHLGMDAREYISRLPVKRIRELHVTGLEYDPENQLWRDHFPMTSADWDITEWAFQRIYSGEWGQPWAAALEYGGTGAQFAWRSKAEVIAQEAPRFYALAHPVKTKG